MWVLMTEGNGDVIQGGGNWKRSQQNQQLPLPTCLALIYTKSHVKKFNFNLDEPYTKAKIIYY